MSMHAKLKLQYDGYHFSENSEEVYNPFSLLKAFQHRKMDAYWFESGTPTFLIRQMQRFHTDITTLEEMLVQSYDFDQPTEGMCDALPLLYQAGYLTIKDYEKESQIYTLGIPNQEVRADVVVEMPDTIYVMELKVDKTAQEVLEQIDAKGYAIPFQTDGRKLVKAGLNFSSETKTLTDWVIVVNQ